MEARVKSAPSGSDLAAIPVMDVRDGGTVRLARDGAAHARALQDACLAWFPGVVRRLVPVSDGFARRWLERSQSPYVDEVRAIAGALGFPGIWFLNGSYQWSCTTLAREEASMPWLARTLDWPYPGLGRYLAVARMRGPAGDFFNVTWPGYVGTLTAMAPGRFAASVNQAPMRRRTTNRMLRPFDLAMNSLGTLLYERRMPPDQLLRQAFETCRTYDEARRLLETMPIARPVIYTLAGCRPGECCVIERTETTANTRESETSAANDWLHRQPGWEGRISANSIFSCTYEEAAGRSLARRGSLASWSGEFTHGSFGWVVPPVLNLYTRIAAEMCPARGLLRVVGYESVTGDELPSPVTLPCEIAA